MFPRDAGRGLGGPVRGASVSRGRRSFACPAPQGWGERYDCVVGDIESLEAQGVEPAEIVQTLRDLVNRGSSPRCVALGSARTVRSRSAPSGTRIRADASAVSIELQLTLSLEPEV